MEVAKIDWRNVDSGFVEDDLYEHINVPKWVDFCVADEPVDDDAWFCRSSCKHPKRAEDFSNDETRTTHTSDSKLRRSVSISDISPLGDRLKRDVTLKKRGMNQPFELLNKDIKHNIATEDGENQDPNLSTPTNHKATKTGKEAIKSGADNKPSKDNPVMKNEEMPKLRSTLSARNLFYGGDILLSKVAEFCNDLKKLATRAKDRENLNDSDALKDQEKERKPLLELGKEKSEVLAMSSGSKGQLRRKKFVSGGNTRMCVNMKNVKGQEPKNLSHIRTCPPTPQFFSTDRESTASTPKPFRIRPLNQEKPILVEVKEINKDAVEKDARSLDVFWFL